MGRWGDGSLVSLITGLNESNGTISSSAKSKRRLVDNEEIWTERSKNRPLYITVDNPHLTVLP